MRPSLEIRARCFGVREYPRRSKNLGRNHDRRMEGHVSDGQYAGRPRRSHRLAAIVNLIGWIAGHGAAAFHTLLVLCYRGHAVRELQAQQRYHGHDDV
jgi:hypothetical protein